MSANTSPVPWQQFKSQLRRTWNQLTDADLEEICAGRLDLVDVVQRYSGPAAVPATQLYADAWRFRPTHPLSAVSN